MKQWFEEITNKHINEKVLIRVSKIWHNYDTQEDHEVKKWENYNARIWGVQDNGMVILDLKDADTLIRVERETIKLMR